MIFSGSKIQASDNSGGILFTCLKITGGFNRKYAKLGDLIDIVSFTRKSYPQFDTIQNKARYVLKVKKQRKAKTKRKKAKYTQVKPYSGIILSLKKWTRRVSGENIRFDKNRVVTLHNRNKMSILAGSGAAAKSYITVGNRITIPIVYEIIKTDQLRTLFKVVRNQSGSVV